MKERVYEEATSAPKAFGLRQSLYIMASIVLIQKFLEFWVVTFYADISQPNTQEVALFFKKIVFYLGLWSGMTSECLSPGTLASPRGGRNLLSPLSMSNLRCLGFCLGTMKGVSSQHMEWWARVPAEMEKIITLWRPATETPEISSAAKRKQGLPHC